MPVRTSVIVAVSVLLVSVATGFVHADDSNHACAGRKATCIAPIPDTAVRNLLELRSSAGHVTCHVLREPLCEGFAATCVVPPAAVVQANSGVALSITVTHGKPITFSATAFPEGGLIVVRAAFTEDPELPPSPNTVSIISLETPGRALLSGEEEEGLLGIDPERP